MYTLCWNLEFITTQNGTLKITWMCFLKVWNDRFIFKTLNVVVLLLCLTDDRLKKGKDQSCRNNKSWYQIHFPFMPTLSSPLSNNKAKRKVLNVKTREIPHDWALASTNALVMELIAVTFSVMIIPQRKLKPFSKTWSKEFHRWLKKTFTNIPGTFLSMYILNTRLFLLYSPSRHDYLWAKGQT